MQIKNTNKVLLTTIVIINITLLGLVFWRSGALFSMADEVGVLNGKLDTLTNQQANMSNFKGAKETLQKGMEIVGSYFVDAEQKISVINWLEELSAISNVQYTLNDVKEGDLLSFDIALTGSYRNIYHFLSLLENGNYWISYEKLALSRGTSREGSAWSANLLINIPGEIK